MLSSEQFIEKIENILNYYKLTASQFAEKIGVQRSSLSHLLSGRNKPSLDFVIKIVEEFPEVDLYWFLFNQGEFPKLEIENNPIVQNPIVQNPIVQNPIVQNPLVQNPIVQNPIVQNPIVQNPIVQNPIVQNPLVQNPIVQNPIPENHVFENEKIEISNISLNREILPLDLFNSNLMEEEAIKVDSSTPTNINQIKSELPKSDTTYNELKNLSHEIALDNLIEKKNVNQSSIVEQEIKNPYQEIKSNPNIETNHVIPKVETKYPAKVKKLMLLYEDGFFEEYNYR
jgi:transcriptional regulator with XRE-family HTH domain